MMIRDAEDSDMEAIAGIYNHYIRNDIATFEEEPVATQDMQLRVNEVRSYRLPWLVSTKGDTITGYAYANRWNQRCAYRYSVEVSVYLDPSQTGQGLGTALYEKLFEILDGMDSHVIIAGISLPNPASVALQEKFGMKKVAHFPEVGLKFGKWIDVGYWQRTN